jgi:hypothetical protein
MKRTLIIGAMIVALGGLYIERVRVHDLVAQWAKPALPSEQPRPTYTMSPSLVASRSPSPTALPGQINLSVTFVSQAPYRIWDHDHEEFCEEAAVLMAVSYIKGDTSVSDPAVAERGLQDIKTWELAVLGHFEDTTAAETARILTDKFGIKQVRLVNNPTVLTLKTALTQGKLVLVPAAGRLLGNLNFTSPGPLYHMLVVKGYMDNWFITNDPGTRNGANYLYTTEVLMNAMHDYNGGDVLNGAKVVIVVG